MEKTMDKDLELLGKICQQYGLGKPECPPVVLKGGFLHKMYSLFTPGGRYAVKLLNPYIMQRETAMENYDTAERLEAMLEEQGLPILPALRFEGRKMQCIEGQFFYLYAWYDGKALKAEEIKEVHCQKIGNLLARIHRLDRKEAVYERSEIHIDWDSYIEQLAVRNDELCRLLRENRSLLYESQNNGNIAVRKLPHAVSVCHNDMDSKNVLWVGDDCRVIDLECLGVSSPYIELYETALCWCGYEKHHIDYGFLRCFLRSYAEAEGQLPADWETIYWSNYGRLEWLEYNLKRSLGIECSEEEIAMGNSEVRETIAHLSYYHNAKDEIMDCLKEFS